MDGKDLISSEHDEERNFLTQESLRPLEVSGVQVNLLQPPELSPTLPKWNARVKLPIAGRDVVLGMHIAKKESKPGCGDNILAAHIPIEGEKGDHLGDLIALTACDGLTTDNEKQHRANVRAYEGELRKIYPEANWNYPDLVIANHQLQFVGGDHFATFAAETVRKLRLAHKMEMKANEFDKSGGLYAVMDNIAWGLFKARAQHNLELYEKIGKAYDRYPDWVCRWNYRAPHGQVLYYLPSSDSVKRWDLRDEPLNHRLQSLADVFASPVDLSGLGANMEVGFANVNLLTDLMIDNLLKEGLSAEAFSTALATKLETQFDAFPAHYRDLMMLKRSGKVVSFPGSEEERVGASINTDGIAFKDYRIRDGGKRLVELGEDGIALTDVKQSVTSLSNKLDMDGYTIDDRAMVVLRID